MSVNVPDTTWRRTSGNGELGTADYSLITLADEQLVTLSGLSLISLSGSYTAIPATEWDKGADLPASEWRPVDGLSEFDNGGSYNIEDTSGDLLVDTTGDYVVDTGVVQTNIPATEWEQDDGE